MKIGLLSDIHGNIAALKAVLFQATACKVTRLFVLGDNVGYYYRASEVLAELEAWDHTSIQGNHERLLLEHEQASEVRRREIREKFGSAFDVALNELGETRLGILRNQPAQLTVTIDGLRFLLCHGSPWNNDEYIYPDAPPETYDRFNQIEADVVLMGHTHYPLMKPVGDKLLINPGSVGQSRAYGGIATWGIINTDNKVYTPQAAAYDRSALVAEISRRDPGNRFLLEVLYRNNEHRPFPS
jgi:putative phosphoesterase